MLKRTRAAADDREVHDEFGFPEERDDWPAAVTALEQSLGRETLALALGVKPAELDLLAAGHDPGGGVVERIRQLQELDERIDLRDPEAVARQLSGAALLQVLPHAKRFLVAFVAADLLIVAALAVFFALR